MPFWPLMLITVRACSSEGAVGMHTLPTFSLTARPHLTNMQIDTDIPAVTTGSKVYGLLRPGKAAEGGERQGSD